VDSAILSFDNGASLSRQIVLSSVGKAARLNLHEWHGTTNADGAAAEVSVDVINAGTIKYSYAIDPKTPGSKATFAKARENLDVTNAASISVAAFANSPKGDFAEQGLGVASKANTASISKYSNRLCRQCEHSKRYSS